MSVIWIDTRQKPKEWEWLENEFISKGYQIKKDKKYYGEFEMNYIHGYGEMIYGVSNSIYIGYWSRNKKEGFGLLLRKNNSKALIGFWKGNKMCGIGKI